MSKLHKSWRQKDVKLHRNCLSIWTKGYFDDKVVISRDLNVAKLGQRWEEQKDFKVSHIRYCEVCLLLFVPINVLLLHRRDFRADRLKVLTLLLSSTISSHVEVSVFFWACIVWQSTWPVYQFQLWIISGFAGHLSSIRTTISVFLLVLWDFLSFF